MALFTVNFTIRKVYRSGIMKKFGDELKKVLQKKGMTQKELSVASGIIESSISLYINNARTPGLESYKKIVNAVGEDFFLGT